MKKTDMITFHRGDKRCVYRDKDGRLYYRADGHIYGTYECYCIKKSGKQVPLLKLN